MSTEEAMYLMVENIQSTTEFGGIVCIVVFGLVTIITCVSIAVDSNVRKLLKDVKRTLDQVTGIKSYTRKEWEGFILGQCRKALTESIEVSAMEEVEHWKNKYEALLADNKELEDQYSNLALENNDLKKKLTLTTDALAETQDRHDLLSERVKILNSINDDYSLLKNAYEDLRNKLSQVCDEDQRKGDF